MENTHEGITKLDLSTLCFKSRVTYNKSDEMIYIEHFSDKGKLLSKVIVDYEDAYDYARMLTEVADFALGVE